MSELVPTLSWDEGKFEFQRKLGNFVQYFQVNLPTNGFGIPMQIIDPVGIAHSLLHCDTTDDMPNDVVDRALIDINFEDGMPIIDGTPFWERLDGEQVDYYKLFKEYREALYVTGTRSIAKLAATHDALGRNLSALAKVYHWQLRCRAYDQYKRAEHERKRFLEIQKLESRHASAAEKLMEQGLTYLEEHPEQLSPKLALQMVQLAIKTSRLAIGLNPDKPGSGDGGTGTSITINQAASNAGELSASVGIVNGQEGAQELSHMQSILSILDRTGALAQVKTVDADFEVVKE